MARLLARAGWVVVAAATVAEALEALGAGPGCIMLDLDLPDGPGESVLRRVREGGLEIRVVVCSACGSEERLDSVRALGPDALLRKPVDFADVLRACGA
jgi:DNA-binding response OmpR family regulator